MSEYLSEQEMRQVLRQLAEGRRLLGKIVNESYWPEDWSNEFCGEIEAFLEGVSHEACPHCNPCRHSAKLFAAEAAMRNLASSVSAGGFNDMNFDPEKFEEKIRDGIDTLIRVERQRAAGPMNDGEPAAWGLFSWYDGTFWEAFADKEDAISHQELDRDDVIRPLYLAQTSGHRVGPRPGTYKVTVACDGLRNKYGITPRDAVEMEWDGSCWRWENEDGVEDFTHMVTHWKDASGNWIAFIDSDAQREQAK